MKQKKNLSKNIKGNSVSKGMQEPNTALNYVITIFVGIFFFLYPLYYRNFYFDIVQCRFYLLIIATGVLSLVALGIFYYLYGIKKHILGTITTLDWFVFLLWFMNFLSVLGSNYGRDTLIGTSGRRAGLITLSCYLFLYLWITRYYSHDKGVYYCLFISSVLVSVVAIFQFVDIDFLGFYNNIAEKYKETYFTTMGHINVVASFYGILLPMVMVFYIRAKKSWECIASGVVLIVSMTGLYVIGCESGILIFAFTFLTGLLVTPVLAKLYRLFFAFGCSFVIWKILLILNDKTVKPRKLETIQKLIDTPVVFWSAVFSMAVLTIGFYIWNRWGEQKKISFGKKNKSYYIGIFSFVGIILVAGLFAMIYFSTVGRDVPLGKFENILRMNQRFGSYRGYIWNLVIEEFMDLPPFKKLIGVGCDALKPFLMEEHHQEMVAVTGFTYDNAHNEFLQYLITTGIFGLVAYLAVLWTGLRSSIKQLLAKPSEPMLIAVYGVFGYLIQSLVDINQCVTTPIFVMVFAIMINQVRKMEEN